MFRIGDKVICIKKWDVCKKWLMTHTDAYDIIALPEVGKRYTVKGFTHYDKTDYISITLKEINNPIVSTIEVAFPIEWFEIEHTLSLKREKLKESINLN